MSLECMRLLSLNQKSKDDVEFCDKMSIFYFKEDVFRTVNVSHEELSAINLEDIMISLLRIKHVIVI